MNDTNEELPYLPFHAIHDFMRPDYRDLVVRSVLTAFNELPAQQRAAIERLTRMLVRIPGFRNSVKAPVLMRIRPTSEAMVNSPHLTATLCEAWAVLHADLRQQVYDFLRERGWEIASLEIDRTSLVGFKPTWPKGEGFEVINAAFRQKYPDHPASNDDISLMAVWVSCSLPFVVDDQQNENP